jgi:hypothetical protein
MKIVRESGDSEHQRQEVDGINPRDTGLPEFRFVKPAGLGRVRVIVSQNEPRQYEKEGYTVGAPAGDIPHEVRHVPNVLFAEMIEHNRCGGKKSHARQSVDRPVLWILP